MHLLRTRIALFLLSSLVLTVAGCNSSATPSTTTGTGTATLSSSSLTFTAATGATSSAQTVTLSNQGTASLTISGIAITGTNPTAFAATNTCGASLAAGASCTLSITFTPASATTFSAAISITDSATGSPQTITLAGTTSTTSSAQAVLNPGTLTFGATTGSTSPPQTIALSNPGNAALTISNIAITGTGAPAFAQTNNCGTSLAVSATCTISLTFSPTSTATYAAGLVITDNASTGTTQTASLNGTGTPALASQATLTPASLPFSVTPGTTSAAQIMVLSNTGTTALNLASIALTGTNASAFTETNNCPASLAVNATCNISVTFIAPATAGTSTANVVFTDDAAGSPQTALLSGIASATTAPQITFTPSSLSFTTSVGTPSAPEILSLSNSGTAPLAISGITITGANATSFAQTNTCPASLAVNATCTVSITFSPTTATTYAASINVADNAAASPQTATLSGTGATGTPTHTLITEPDQQFGAIYSLINSATSTIEMTMYELTDTTVEQALAAAAAKGINVRVILDQSLEKSSNTPAYNYLLANGVHVVFSNTFFQATHQKSIIIDQKTVAIMTLNLTPVYYSTSRDFALIETDVNDIGAIEATFNEDFTNAATKPYPTYTPALGDDLIWSPTNATSALLSIINSATHTLQVENEEMGNATIVSALENAAKNGVQVQVIMTNSGSYTSQFNALVAAGVHVSTYVDNNTALYIHAKVIVADYGFSSQQAFLGSENFSVASLTENRELGLTLTDPAILLSLHNTLASDFQGAAVWP